ncbi:MAG TPA: hypothetical protein PLG66_17040, partial [Calditrichia bacterium]|nr:hypothetical protein [Calditrichia bacterium]
RPKNSLKFAQFSNYQHALGYCGWGFSLQDFFSAGGFFIDSRHFLPILKKSLDPIVTGLSKSPSKCCLWPQNGQLFDAGSVK